MTQEDIDLQKIQVLISSYQGWFNFRASIIAGGIVGVLILVATMYYQNVVNLFGAYLGYGIVMAATFYFIRDAKKAHDAHMSFINGLLLRIEKGEKLESIEELRKMQGKGVKTEKTEPKSNSEKLETEQRRNSPRMKKNKIDKIFELCLLLITVIAAALLQYASFVYSQDFVLKEVNYAFRATTIPIFILVITWIVLMLFPSIAVQHEILGKIRRFAKEFCWTFFGNFFVLEILMFFYLGFSEEVSSSQSVAQYATLFSFVFTFLATWQYKKADMEGTQKTSRSFKLWSIIEHSVIYVCSYFLLMFIIYGSAVIPLP